MLRIILAVAVALVLVSAAAGQQKAPPSPLLEDGMLLRVKPQLAQIFHFTLDGPRLKLDRQRWSEAPPNLIAALNQASPIEHIFRHIQTLAGGGSSGMTVSNRYRELRFTGSALSGRVLTRDQLIRFELEEVGAPNRSLEFQDDGESFRLFLSGRRDDLYLRQDKEYGFTLAAVIGGKAIAAEGASFLDLYKRRRETFDKDVLPILNGLSIHLFVPPSSADLKSAVRAILSRSPALLEEGKRLLADLDHDQFAIRDNASKLLSERYEIYKDLIAATLKDPSISVETERRLQKIRAAHADSQKVTQVIAALDLLNDAEFLIGLLDETAAPERGPIAARLEQVTGQRLGQDVAAWRKWLAARANK
jgi:hypothetical protein